MLVAIVQVPAAEFVFILLVAKHEVGGGQHGGGDRYSRLLRTAPELTRVVTCSRTSRNARWTCRVWTVPAARTKAGREHRVRLCSRAIKIVDEARRLGIERTAGAVPGLVFQSQRGKAIGDARLSGVLQQLGIGAVPHGFRSSFRDWASERTDHPREVIEAALAQLVRNRTEAAYARSDLFERRRQLMNDWMSYLNGRRQ